MSDIKHALQGWYSQSYRKLPWRATKNPYKIWLSEIILQQTRVEQGKKYYERFVEKYPNVEKLAAASEQEVLKMWQGLGYYSRARNLRMAATQIVNDFNGVFPDNFKDLKKLKGVGDYTAAAVASFAYGLPEAVLDGNVFRVLSRYFNDKTPIDSSKGKKLFQAYADEFLDRSNPAMHNQAMMELGALICKPKKPLCDKCPLHETCGAFRQGNPEKLPVKAKKIKVTKRYFHYFVFSSNFIQLTQRDKKGIWKNMYQFPMIESVKKVKKIEIEKKAFSTFRVNEIQKIDHQNHILSHQIIEATFWKINSPIVKEGIINVDVKEFHDFPIPRLIERFIEQNNILQ